MQSRTFSIDINTTKKCNLRCTYCFEVKNNAMKNRNFEDPAAFIQFIRKLQASNGFFDMYTDICINFWGGEPSMNPKLYYELVNEFKDDLQIRFFMYSNGYKFNKKMLASFKELQETSVMGHPKIVIQISYDGMPVHDFDRIDPRGLGSSQKVRQTIYDLQDNHIFYVLKSTISPVNFKYMFEAYKDYIQFTDFLYNPTIDLHAGFTREDINKYSEDLYNALMDIAIFEHKQNINKFKWFNNDKALCSAGANLIAVNTNGDLLPCHGALYTNYEDHVFGNIKDEDVILKLINMSRTYGQNVHNLPEKCKACNVNFCHKCNVVKFEQSKKTDYFSKWSDHDNQEYLCEFFKIVHHITESIREIKRGM